MFLIELDYPSEAEEIQIARTTTGESLPPTRAPDDPEPRSSGTRAWCGGCRCPTTSIRMRRGWCARPARPARRHRRGSSRWSRGEPGPRAVQYLILGAKARAALLGSYMVRLEDVSKKSPRCPS